jgi:aminodeoxyfutalosine synthase
MLYGHFESYEDRIEHLQKIRNLQDLTNGFQVFIPLKYRNSNNNMSQLGEISVTEDLKNYAVSRIFLDNVQHIKAYWPMLGIDTAQTAIHFGVNDLDGTVLNSTKIYSMAGMEHLKPKTPAEIEHIITQVKRTPAERNTLYKTHKKTIL